MSDESQASSRRNFLMRMGIALNVVAASLIAVPVVGYIAAAMRKRSYHGAGKRPVPTPSTTSWVRTPRCAARIRASATSAPAPVVSKM